MNLADYIQIWRKRTFIWGKYDCLHFVTDWLDIKYPGNISYKAKYNSSYGAMKLAMQKGWKEELNKAFEISKQTVPVDGDLLVEVKNVKIPSIFIAFDGGYHTIKEDDNFVSFLYSAFDIKEGRYELYRLHKEK